VVAQLFQVVVKVNGIVFKTGIKKILHKEYPENNYGWSYWTEGEFIDSVFQETSTPWLDGRPQGRTAFENEFYSYLGGSDQSALRRGWKMSSCSDNYQHHNPPVKDVTNPILRLCSQGDINDLTGRHYLEVELGVDIAELGILKAHDAAGTMVEPLSLVPAPRGGRGYTPEDPDDYGSIGYFNSNIGLTWDSRGNITGTPNKLGKFPFGFFFRDAAGQGKESRSLLINVVLSSPQLNYPRDFTSDGSPAGAYDWFMVDGDSGTISPATTKGTPAYTYSYTGALPDGTTFDTATGVFTLDASYLSVSDESGTVTVTVTDSNAKQDVESYSWFRQSGTPPV
jgi:hypothetical protein